MPVYVCSSKNILISSSAFCVSGVPPIGKNTKPCGAPAIAHHKRNVPSSKVALSHTWIQLQHRLRSTHSPLRSHQHTIIKQRIECSTSEDRRRSFHLVHIREERRYVRIASVSFAGVGEVCGDVATAVSIELSHNGWGGL